MQAQDLDTSVLLDQQQQSSNALSATSLEKINKAEQSAAMSVQKLSNEETPTLPYKSVSKYIAKFYTDNFLHCLNAKIF